MSKALLKFRGRFRARRKLQLPVDRKLELCAIALEHLWGILVQVRRPFICPAVHVPWKKQSVELVFVASFRRTLKKLSTTSSRTTQMEQRRPKGRPAIGTSRASSAVRRAYPVTH